MTNAEYAEKLASLESLLSETRNHAHQLEAELAEAEERQLAMEQSRAVLESVGAERLATITLLQSEVESGRVRGEQVRVMREKLGTLEELLMNLQEEVRTHTHIHMYTHTCTHTHVHTLMLHTLMYTHSHTVGGGTAGEQRVGRRSSECRLSSHGPGETAGGREEREGGGEEGERGKGLGTVTEAAGHRGTEGRDAN